MYVHIKQLNTVLDGNLIIGCSYRPSLKYFFGEKIKSNSITWEWSDKKMKFCKKERRTMGFKAICTKEQDSTKHAQWSETEDSIWKLYGWKKTCFTYYLFCR